MERYARNVFVHVGAVFVLGKYLHFWQAVFMETTKFPYDAIYKSFCADPAFVKSLLLDFVKLPFVADFDFASLQPFAANYATPAFASFANDLVWRLKLNGNDCIVFLMLEFQSRSEKHMALRIANYVTLFLHQLMVGNQVDITRGLPPILPIVIYNGASRWRAPVKLRELFGPMPDGLVPFQASQEYFLLDLRHLEPELVAEARGEASYFVRLERAESIEDVREALASIMQGCKSPAYDNFRQLVYKFLLCSMERAAWKEDISKEEALEEFEMLYSDGPVWIMAIKEKAIREGLERGRVEGLEKGRQEGRASIFLELMSTLRTKLIERFGKLPELWHAPLAALTEPGSIMELMAAAATASTAAEFEAKLMQMASSRD